MYGMLLLHSALHAPFSSIKLEVQVLLDLPDAPSVTVTPPTPRVTHILKLTSGQVGDETAEPKSRTGMARTIPISTGMGPNGGSRNKRSKQKGFQQNHWGRKPAAAPTSLMRRAKRGSLARLRRQTTSQMQDNVAFQRR